MKKPGECPGLSAIKLNSDGKFDLPEPEELSVCFFPIPPVYQISSKSSFQ
jgi:hypothetical protein